MSRSDATSAEEISNDPKGLELHARLLAADPTAYDDLWIRYFEDLVENAWWQLHAGPERDDRARDMAMAIIVKMRDEPQRFDPSRGKSLWGYMTMDLKGDLLNYFEWAKRNPPPASLEPADDDDDDAVGKASAIGNLVSNDPRPDEVLESREARAWVLSVRDVVATSDEERIVFDLQYVHGEKATAAFAEGLGVTALPEKGQRDHVQKIKDRVAKRLRRQVRETMQ
ncbi:MAG TPA: hypothetical protein VGT61_11120 [Thermomicrobiales bacterium]|jgi:hypothetical protein|nr:hypothetical protein [Thermomicrobiales bacterium]